MIDQVQNALLPDTTASSAGQKNNAANTAGLESFHGALKEAVSSTLERFGLHSGNVKISITHAGDSSESALPESHESVVAAKSASVSTGSSNVSASGGNSSSSSTDASSGPPDNGYDPFLQASYSNPFANASTTAGTKTTASTPATAPAETAQESFDNAYWASQPPAVQALRTMTDLDQRTDAASQLANEGYSIDVPIMVWGWDPYTTTTMRQAEGYTWVPSALQQPVEVAPGLSAFGNMGAYAANTPPSGSIAV